MLVAPGLPEKKQEKKRENPYQKSVGVLYYGGGWVY